MMGKSNQAQEIVRQRDREERILKEEKRKKGNKPQSKPINDTEYCTLWKRVTVNVENDGVAAIELITVKELKQDEVRFAFYKKEDDNLRFISRPLDVTPSVLKELLEKAKDEGIIT